MFPLEFFCWPNEYTVRAIANKFRDILLADNYHGSLMTIMPAVIDKPIYTNAVGVATKSLALNVRLTEWSKW